MTNEEKIQIIRFALRLARAFGIGLNEIHREDVKNGLSADEDITPGETMIVAQEYFEEIVKILEDRNCIENKEVSK